VIYLKILGIDLAGKSTNPTGICIFKNNKIELETIYLDDEILRISREFKPDIIAIDAPIIQGEVRIRQADKLLKKFKAIPPTLPGMKPLAIRGSKLAVQMKKCCKVIEVFPTATAKILGIYNKDFRITEIKLDIKVKNKHELDAYLCCITAKLFLEGKTVEIGDEEGFIVIPK
jgi:predicted nuclease with RNAse H fold